MARRACATHVAPAFGCQRLHVGAHVRRHLAQHIPNEVHGIFVDAVAQVVEVRGDAVGVLVAAQALDGFGDELYSDHAVASRASHSRLVTGRSISPLWSMSKSQYSICISSERSYHSPSMTTLCITMPIS